MKGIRLITQVTPKEGLSLEKYLRDINKKKLLSPEEEVDLAGKIHKGDRKALEILVTSNLRFVVSVAKQYQNQGLELTDLINEGNLGLLRAAELFDETKGFKFISYAVWWIRQSIIQALAENSRIIRLPKNKINSINKITKSFTKLEQDYQREPTSDEIAQILHVQQKIVEEAFILGQINVSIDASAVDDEDPECKFANFVNFSQLPGPDHNLLRNSLKTEVERALGTLRKREAEIIRYAFGLSGEPVHSIEEIGRKLDLSQERVRQIKEKAVNRLKNNHRYKLLKEYLNVWISIFM